MSISEIASQRIITRYDSRNRPHDYTVRLFGGGTAEVSSKSDPMGWHRVGGGVCDCTYNREMRRPCAHLDVMARAEMDADLCRQQAQVQTERVMRWVAIWEALAAQAEQHAADIIAGGDGNMEGFAGFVAERDRYARLASEARRLVGWPGVRRHEVA